MLQNKYYKIYNYITDDPNQGGMECKRGVFFNLIKA